MKNFLIASTLCAAMLLPMIPISSEAAESTSAPSQSIAELTPAPGGAKGIVSMTFDDGNQATAAWLNEKFKQYNLHGSTMLITDNNLKTEEQISFWKRIYADGHLEPQSHSRTHIVLPTEHWANNNNPDTLNNNTESNFVREIYESGLAIENAFGSYPLCFAPSNNTMAEGGMHLVKRFYYAMRQGTRFSSDIQSLDPIPGSSDPGGWYNLYMTGTSGKEQTILSGLNTAATSGGWLVIMCHSIGENKGDSTYAKFEPVLREMSMAQERGDVWVATFGDATKYIRQRQNTSVNLKETGSGSYSLSLVLAEKTADRLPLPTEVFNLPLTVRINLPEGATHLAYDLGEGEVLLEGERDERGNHALISMRADFDHATLRFTNEKGQTILSSDALTMMHGVSYSDSFTYTLYVKNDVQIERVKVAGGDWIEEASLKTKIINNETYYALPYTPPLNRCSEYFHVSLVLEGEKASGVCSVRCSLLPYFDALLQSATDTATEMLALNAMILLRDIANAEELPFEDYQSVQDAIMKYHYRPKAPDSFATPVPDTTAIHATLHYDLPCRPAIVLTPDAGVPLSAYTFLDAEGNPLSAKEENGRLVLLLRGTDALDTITVRYDGGTADVDYSLATDYARIRDTYAADALYISFYHTIECAKKYLGTHAS